MYIRDVKMEEEEFTGGAAGVKSNSTDSFKLLHCYKHL